MKRTILFSLVVVAFISCKKDNDECKTDTTSVQGTYKITAAKYKLTSTSQDEDYLVNYDACQRDNTYTFGANSIFTYTDVGIQCTPPDTESGTWSLTGTTLIIEGEPYMIDDFNCKELTIYTTDYDVPGDKMTFTFTKQ